MSEESEFSEDVPADWIQWFCGLDDNSFFCDINEDFIRNEFNLYGLRHRVQKYNEAMRMILKATQPAEEEVEDPAFLEIYQHATVLYGLIHARYITTPEGLAIMRERYLTGRFGTCPRVMCEKQNVLPIAISEDLKIARVKVYCPRCKDVYSPKKKSPNADGAYFGTSFPHLLLMTYPDLKPFFKREEYAPKVYGFKLECEDVFKEIKEEYKAKAGKKEVNGELNKLNEEQKSVKSKERKNAKSKDGHEQHDYENRDQMLAEASSQHTEKKKRNKKKR